jgi:hypothetical protein
MGIPERQAQTLLANIRLDLKGLVGSKTVAYSGR